eukprot:jgi/Botrbrau1/3729/Bobra.0363s0014.1
MGRDGHRILACLHMPRCRAVQQCTGAPVLHPGPAALPGGRSQPLLAGLAMPLLWRTGHHVLQGERERLAGHGAGPAGGKPPGGGGRGGQLITVDADSGKSFSSVTGPEGVVALRGAGRGLLAAGTANGKVHLLDLRSGAEVGAPFETHVEGLVCMDARAGLLATCGYGRRAGQKILESYVKVYDIRGVPRMTGSISFPAPSLLQFHPQFSNTLLIASANGMFSLSDASGATFSPPQQVDTHGSQVTACQISPTGQVIALATQIGWLYLWGSGSNPKVTNGGTVPQKPPPRPPPRVKLMEEDGFGVASRFKSTGGRLTDADGKWTWDHRMPPRVVPQILQDAMEVHDFFGHVANPYFKRELPKGEATKRAALLRNERQRPSLALHKTGVTRWDRSNKGGEGGGSGLPAFYQRVHIRKDHAKRGFQDFDFPAYNRTRFGGLENDIANCYANALIQALYFIPPVRAAFLSIRLDSQREFSLVDELALLFRMLAAPGSKICQASNMLRALRQSREAVALGLVEGHAQKHDLISIDIEVEANKDKNLRRRIQSLQRFVLEQIHREDLERRLRPHLIEGLSSLAKPPAVPNSATPTSPSSSQPAPTPPLPPPSPSSEEDKERSLAQGERIGGGPKLPGGEPSEGIEPTPAGQATTTAAPSQATPPAEDPQSGCSIVERVFGIRMLQKAKVLTGSKPERLSERTIFQVELQYPPAKERPTRATDPRPCFGELMARSLRPDDTLKAWFDDVLQYQPMRQTRVPVVLPPVLAVSCGLQDVEDLLWWQPYPAGNNASRPWLPCLIKVVCNSNDFSVSVSEPPSVAEALQLDDAAPESVTAVYGLTGMIALVQDEPEEAIVVRNRPGPTPKAKPAKIKEDHLVAHMKVPDSYLDMRYGYDLGSAVPPSPGQSPYPGKGNPFAVPPAVAGLPPLEGSVGSRDATSSGEPSASTKAPPSEPDHPLLDALPDNLMDDIFGKVEVVWDDVEDTLGQSKTEVVPDQEQEEGNILGQRVVGSTAEGGLPLLQHSESGGLHLSQRGLTVSSQKSEADPEGQGNWLLFNDFAVTPTSEAEVLRLYGSQKIPCLLYFTEVGAEAEWEAKLRNVVTEPVLNKEELRGLVARAAEPQLRNGLVLGHSGPSMTWSSMKAPPKAALRSTIVPFKEGEWAEPGTLFGLDAEFVALSPPDKVIRGGVEIETQALPPGSGASGGGAWLPRPPAACSHHR